MDSNQFNHTPKFVELLNSQQDNFFCFLEDSAQLSSSKLPVFGTQGTEASSAKEDTPAEHRERRIWTPVDDVVLISSWLNTSKDLLVGNEKRSGTFWKRIASYFAASPKVAGCGQREASNYKQRWQKINEQVNKFCGSYEAATREKSIGQNENDILKRAHEIFFSNHKKKKSPLNMLGKSYETTRNGVSFHAQLRGGSVRMVHNLQPLTQMKQRVWMIVPPGVKAAKSKKAKDLAMKERLSKMSLLDSLIAKKEPLAEYEEALKKI
ncbi:PREDICTED: glutathione S-transferase T3-like [Brassica oleracea var. oleracea]|uniref:Myb-like domain-containing protein n=1 Tax=Brassica oleracea var. oleracea TaxID=109376 RepID=A0A0D3E508_BRAOL|nr:PREDICTED: glutathione S-transferase T3-like [Brassica oleracea var. oleracea]